MPAIRGDSKEALERFIVAEVKRQLEPTHSLLKSLHEWQLSFWSNGSGRPEGFFQGRIKADDRRYGQLEDETKEQSKTLSELKDFMLEQRITREARVKAETEKAERHKRYWLIAKWAVGTIGPAVIGLSVWLYHQTEPVLKIIWQDYLKAHPTAASQLENRSQYDVEKVYAGGKQQDATIPPLTR